MKDKKVKVVEVVEDSHLQIGSFMKKQHPTIQHSHDIWHAAKNLGKKIVAAGQEKECRQLLDWTPDIVNHFWHTCQKASSHEEFKDIWLSALHHVVGEHEWVLPTVGPGSEKCHHGPLEQQDRREWLKKGSAPHNALRKIMFDVRLFNKISYYLNFRSTADLENFQQHILMYAAKRFAYIPPVFRARNLLAALDYNHNVNRSAKLKKDGTPRYEKLFNKKSGRWTAVSVKQDKSYDHINNLAQKTVTSRLEDPEGLSKKVVLAADDPRRLSANIASVSPKPTKDLVAEKISRMK